eukprot:1884224-Rhodomonas_salina.2
MAYGPNVRWYLSTLSLRFLYAMSGTDMPYGAVQYAGISVTSVEAHSPRRQSGQRQIKSFWSHLCTDVVYLPTRCPVPMCSTAYYWTGLSAYAGYNFQERNGGYVYDRPVASQTVGAPFTRTLCPTKMI